VTGDQNAGRSHCLKFDNNSFEMVEQFIYLGTTLTNKSPIQEESKRSFMSVCHHSM
jgi:hypothetical protein